MLKNISRNCAIKAPQVAETFEKSDFFLLLRLEMLFIVARHYSAYFLRNLDACSRANMRIASEHGRGSNCTQTLLAPIAHLTWLRSF
jgi:hypothetical protein